jgi:hypothetical protein
MDHEEFPLTQLQFNLARKIFENTFHQAAVGFLFRRLYASTARHGVFELDAI